MNAGDMNQLGRADFTLKCSNLSSAQDFYVREHGFRLDMLYPADNPQVVVLSASGIRIRLEQIAAAGDEPSGFLPSVVIQRYNRHAWGDGRAGMQYRDLIPHRLGGKYIASHIRIPVGGPVPDYVHHHHVRLQLIYCYKGWVRVVYEDQGPPFVMHAGDCVLQPPHIRHRVLECSDGMEVVEIACPAEHETLVEHDIELPTDRVDVDRQYGGQNFVFHQAEGSHWQARSPGGFISRDTGIAEATKGIASAAVLRPAEGMSKTTLEVSQELFFSFVLNGSATLRVEGEQFDTLHAGDSFVIPEDSSFDLEDISRDLEILQVISPG